MTAFWITAGLLTALSLAVLCWPLLRRRENASASRRAINAAIFRDQLADLERDLASGTLSRDDYATARDELERRVLEDVADDGSPAAEAPKRLPRTAISLGLSLPVAAVALYFVLGNPAALDPAAQQGNMPSQAEVEQMVSTLAARLEKNPENPQGWAMLGRSYKVMGRLEEAGKAFDKAGAFMESEPELMLEVAELSAELNQGKVEGRGAALLKKVLQTQPDNPQALVLAGTDAYFRQDYPAALRHWERVLAQVPPDSEDARNLGAGIEKVRSLMGQGASTPAPAAKPAPTGKAAAVSGTVSLSPALKDKTNPDDVVFIFARPTNGPRMPLAVLRARVADLPKDFTLDDSMAMSPDAKLSSASELRIEARISKGGDAIAKPGDLSGEVASVKPGATGLKIVIDKTLP
ncbi:MAG TPA: c-type cytochrome biogenesis protein CcmI [Zoogloea sp.]|nr:c-type cytochrome biogenesis protein CcmI [Zoogloea sp.]